MKIGKIGMLVCGLVFWASSAGAATVSLSPSASSVASGGVFSVDVFADDILPEDELLAFGFNVNADSGLIYTGATIVSPFLDDTPFFPETDVAGSVFPGVSGNGIHLATLSFQAGTAPGLFSIFLTTDPEYVGFSQGLISELNALDISAQTQVNVTPVPAPAALPLLLSGLAGLYFTSRRRRQIR